MEQQHKFSLSYYLLVFFTVILLESIFFSGAAVKEISYSKFRDLLASDKIQSVIVEDHRIFGLEKSDASTSRSASKSKRLQPRHRKRSTRYSSTRQPACRPMKRARCA